MRRLVSLASLALTTIIPTHGLMRRVRRFVANIGAQPTCFLTSCVPLRTPVHVENTRSSENARSRVVVRDVSFYRNTPRFNPADQTDRIL